MIADKPELQRILETLVAYGAPIGGYEASAHLPLETALVAALQLSRTSASLLRALPVVLAANAPALDRDALWREADRRALRRELGMLIDLTAEVSGETALQLLLEAFAPPTVEMPQSWFPSRSPRDRALADARTPAVVRKWGFIMNMPADVFASFFEKHRIGPRA